MVCGNLHHACYDVMELCSMSHILGARNVYFRMVGHMDAATDANELKATDHGLLSWIHTL